MDFNKDYVNGHCDGFREAMRQLGLPNTLEAKNKAKEILAEHFDKESSASMVVTYPADKIGHEPCPMGCGNLTDDIHGGGPCSECWNNVYENSTRQE